MGVRLSVKCKQIPRTSGSCSGPTGLASENVERSRSGHSLEKMWFSFGGSGSCGTQDAEVVDISESETCNEDARPEPKSRTSSAHGV